MSFFNRGGSVAVLPLWPLAGLVHGSPEFKSSTNSHLVWLQPAGFFWSGIVWFLLFGSVICSVLASLSVTNATDGKQNNSFHLFTFIIYFFIHFHWYYDEVLPYSIVISLPTAYLWVHKNLLKRVRAFQIELEFGSVEVLRRGENRIPGDNPPDTRR